MRIWLESLSPVVTWLDVEALFFATAGSAAAQNLDRDAIVCIGCDIWIPAAEVELHAEGIL